MEQKRAIMECVGAVKAFVVYYDNHHRQDEPQAVHWTIARLLKAGHNIEKEGPEHGNGKADCGGKEEYQEGSGGKS